MHNAPVKQKRTIMDNEIALIKLVKKGDKKAYNTLVLKYQDRLVFSVYKFLKDFELAQDIAQEAFIKAYKNIEKFKNSNYCLYVSKSIYFPAFPAFRRICSFL